MSWNTEENTIPKADAIVKIKQMAKDNRIKGHFKVFYDGRLTLADDLPEQVEMSKVTVSAVQDQA